MTLWNIKKVTNPLIEMANPLTEMANTPSSAKWENYAELEKHRVY